MPVRPVRDVVDFDAAWAEIESLSAQAPRIVVQGETVELPSAFPAKLVLYQVRNRDRLEGEHPDPEAVAEMSGMLFGADRVEGWIDAGMPMAKLYGAFLHAQRAMHGKEKSTGEAPPPETGGSSTTSSPDGVPSKPTSNASTDGT